MNMHSILENNKIQSPILETMSLVSSAVTGTNYSVVRSILTGTMQAVDYLTREQESCLASLDRKRELEKEKFSCYSEIICNTALSVFCSAFTKFDTPGALAIVNESRAKLGINNNSIFPA